MKSLAKIAVLQNWPKLNMKDKDISVGYRKWRRQKLGGEKKLEKNGAQWALLSCVWIVLFQPKSDDAVVTRALLMTEALGWIF